MVSSHEASVGGGGRPGSGNNNNQTGVTGHKGGARNLGVQVTLVIILYYHYYTTIYRKQCCRYEEYM